MGHWLSKYAFQKTRTVNVLLPGTTTNAGPTYTYFYDPRGNERLSGLVQTIDSAFEVTFRAYGRSEVGIKTEVFNITDQQEKILVNNTVWCNVDSNAACTAARANFGTAIARGSFQTPRNYRVSALIRF